MMPFVEAEPTTTGWPPLLSSLTLLVPIIVASFRRTELAQELSLLIASLIATLHYHACWHINESLCLLTHEDAASFDFLFATCAISSVVVHIFHVYPPWLKTMTNHAISLAVIYFVWSGQVARHEYLWPVYFAAMVILGIGIDRLAFRPAPDWVKWNRQYLFLAVLLTAPAFGIWIIPNYYEETYGTLHALWHMFGSLGLAFGLHCCHAPTKRD